MKGFVKIEHVYVEKKIFDTYFSCDYEKCKGACCWDEVDVELDGGSLLPTEAKEIRASKTVLADYVSSDFKENVLDKPTYQRSGNYFASLKQGKCVLLNNACGTCAIKLAHRDGKMSFPIPVYCQLYPLYAFIEKGLIILCLMDTFGDTCKPAYEKGLRENMKVYRFCEQALIRLFGEEFYKKLHLKAVKLDSSK